MLCTADDINFHTHTESFKNDSKSNHAYGLRAAGNHNFDTYVRTESCKKASPRFRLIISTPRALRQNRFMLSSILSLVVRTLRKLYFHFLSNQMGYGCGDSFPFDFEPNGIPFGSESK